jgi:hypothetical protein
VLLLICKALIPPVLRQAGMDFPDLKNFHPKTINETFLKFGSYGTKGKMFWTRQKTRVLEMPTL